jgi:hypothetical protein
VIFSLTLHICHFIKFYRISAGYTKETRTHEYKILVRKHEGKRPFGINIPGQYDDIKIDLAVIICENVYLPDLDQYMSP